MTEPAVGQRVIILAPIGRDAELMCTHLEKGGMTCFACKDMDEVCRALEEGAGVLLVTEEVLTRETTRALAKTLVQQPAWSEIPIIILTGLPALEARQRSFHELGRRTNVTLVDRPVRIQSLISAAQSALNTRLRQYEIRDLMEKLQDRVHERDRFLAILGHELRNPLGAILLASQMLDDDDRLDGEHARLIERQSRHLTRIVNDLLDLSRVVSGKIVLKPQIIDLGRLLEQSLETLQESARSHGVAIHLRMPPEPLIVKADPVRADQIITNVLTNAIKYTPEGGQVVVTLARDGEQAAIYVKDDGVGIAEDRIDTIFELFAQAENAIGRAQGGMGIGLALVRNLIELHGGTIDAKSDGIGKGSEFVIRLPISSEALTATEKRSARATRLEPARHIVIVEDNTDVRELLRLKLRRLGHTVDAFGDGISGVSGIVTSKPHMALIDIGLPRLDGYQVASQVRSQLGGDVVLIAVSGFGQPEDKRKALEAGFDDHLTKPADVQDIESLLARYPLKE
ncbi:MAG TPA: hybrid sensor histidine kinase/response regulator [Thermoanaerobaculia bacterium]|nr:hybrid sensor histidine kinase/response regulator [Thermoanaerobaculia bacterium]